MATLDEERRSWPCPCGNGEVVRVFDGPTAMYQRGAEVSRSLECEVCSQDWELSRGGSITLRSKADRANVEAVSTRVKDAHAALVHDVVLPTVAALQAHAEASGSKAADWYGALQRVMPNEVGGDLSEFKRRRGRLSLRGWLMNQVGHGNVAGPAKAVGLSVPAEERASAYSQALGEQQTARAAVRTHTYSG